MRERSRPARPRLRHVLRPRPGGRNHDVPHGGVIAARPDARNCWIFLPPDDPRAIRSRRDLARINAVMRQQRIMAQGAGRVFRAHACWPIWAAATAVSAGRGQAAAETLARREGRDRSTARPSSARETRAGFAALGWSCESHAGRYFRNLAAAFSPTSSPPICSCIISTMRRWRGCWRWWRRGPEALSPASRAARALPCWERGWSVSLGANDVTRHDAVASVRAGFAGKELSALWPGGWLELERTWRLSLHPSCSRRAMRYDAVIDRAQGPPARRRRGCWPRRAGMWRWWRRRNFPAARSAANSFPPPPCRC